MGNVYIRPDVHIVLDEPFTTAHTFISGANSYNGRNWYYDNNTYASSTIAGSGLQINCNTNSSDYYGGTRTAPGIRIQLSSLISNIDLVRYQVFMIVELETAPTKNFEGYGLGFEVDQATANEEHVRIVRIWETAASNQLECTENASGGQPKVTVTGADKGMMLLLGQGQYAGYKQANFTMNPFDANWTLLGSNPLRTPNNRARRWHNGWIFLHAQTVNTLGGWSPVIKRLVVGYKQLF